MGPFPSSKGNKYILVAVNYLSKRVVAKALPTNDARVVIKFLKSLFSRFEHRAYWALKHVNFDLKTASDHRKLQLNELIELRDQAYENSVIYKERIKKLHDSKIKNRIFNVGDQVLLFSSRLKIFSRKLKPRWSGPFTIAYVFPYGTIELSQPDGLNFKVNGHRVKYYFGERMVGENRTSWSDKLDDALWAFRTAYKTPIECTPYKLVYGKSCHLLIELEHRAYWALKHAYENSVIYKERIKNLHDSKIKNHILNVDDQVLLFNSRWSGPFTITCVFPYGTIELSQPDGLNFKVNGDRVKHYFGGDIPFNVTPDLHTFPKDN
nr:hypothetical protein [Tanacetum cinerariifolium]